MDNLDSIKIVKLRAGSAITLLLKRKTMRKQ